MKKRLEEAFKEANQNSPCTIFFDELHLMMGKEAHEDRHSKDLVGQFLTEMNTRKKGVLVIGATNEPGQLDTTVARRFKFHYKLHLPSHREKLCLLQSMISKSGMVNLLSTKEIQKAAYMLDGYTVNDLENVVEKATGLAIDRLANANYFTPISCNKQKVFIPCQPEDKRAIKASDVPEVSEVTSVICWKYLESSMKTVKATPTASKKTELQDGN